MVLIARLKRLAVLLSKRFAETSLPGHVYLNCKSVVVSGRPVGTTGQGIINLLNMINIDMFTAAHPLKRVPGQVASMTVRRTQPNCLENTKGVHDR